MPTERAIPVDTTLLPAGVTGRAASGDPGAPGGSRGPRRLRWDIVLGCLLALIAVVVTVLAVSGLRGPAPSRPAAQAPGSQVTVARTGAGTLHVTERFTLPRPAPTMRLSRPDLSSGESGRNLLLPQPAISALTATSPDGGTQVRETPDGWEVTADAGRPLREITIDYDSRGAIVPEPRAPVPGRALLVVTPVTAAVARELAVPVTVSAPGIAVRQATCVTSPATQQLCGVADSSGWTARLRTWQDVAVVVLQADLRS